MTMTAEELDGFILEAAEIAETLLMLNAVRKEIDDFLKAEKENPKYTKVWYDALDDAEKENLIAFMKARDTAQWYVDLPLKLKQEIAKGFADSSDINALIASRRVEIGDKIEHYLNARRLERITDKIYIEEGVCKKIEAIKLRMKELEAILPKGDGDKGDEGKGDE